MILFCFVATFFGEDTDKAHEILSDNFMEVGSDYTHSVVTYMTVSHGNGIANMLAGDVLDGCNPLSIVHRD